MINNLESKKQKKQFKLQNWRIFHMVKWSNKRIVTILLNLFIIFISVQSTINRTMAIEYISMITTPIILLKDDKMISQGTGFFYFLQDSPDTNIIFLVTNYHVLTGWGPEKEEPPKGDNIIFYIHKDFANPGDIKEIRFPLFTKNGKPIWLSSKEFPEADVAVIPLVSYLYHNIKVYAISEDWTESDINIRPGSTINLIGYPYGYYDKKNCLPIWKTGSIASEPDIDFEG